MKKTLIFLLAFFMPVCVGASEMTAELCAVLEEQASLISLNCADEYTFQMIYKENEAIQAWLSPACIQLLEADLKNRKETYIKNNYSREYVVSTFVTPPSRLSSNLLVCYSKKPEKKQLIDQFIKVSNSYVDTFSEIFLIPKSDFSTAYIEGKQIEVFSKEEQEENDRKFLELLKERYYVLDEVVVEGIQQKQIKEEIRAGVLESDAWPSSVYPRKKVPQLHLDPVEDEGLSYEKKREKFQIKEGTGKPETQEKTVHSYRNTTAKAPSQNKGLSQEKESLEVSDQTVSQQTETDSFPEISQTGGMASSQKKSSEFKEKQRLDEKGFFLGVDLLGRGNRVETFVLED